jgi:glycosyltransferase involved in cell wall biosynthesis
MTARLAARLHAVSLQVARVMAKRLRYPIGRIDVVPRGRDPRVIGRRTPERRLAARRALGVDDDRIVVLAVGRHEPAKALDKLVEAFARTAGALPGAHLYVAGREGNASSVLEATIAGLGLNAAVTLLGDRSDVPDLLCAADVFAFSSRREGMPGAVIEAMALEVPIVATALPQVEEVTGADAALLVPGDDTDRLADGIVACATDRAAASRRVENGRTRFEERFTIDQTAQAMVEFYRRALREATSRGHAPRG